MLRSYLILNLSDMNHLPLMERWLLKDHARETIGQLDPILERYTSYRAVPAPEGSERFCPYNWRMTEHWWREPPWVGGVMDHGTAFGEVWPPGYASIVGMPEGAARSAGWAGSPGGPHPPVMIFVQSRRADDFVGKGLTIDEGTNIRWITAHKYPDGVPVDEGEDWFLNVHAKEVAEQSGLKRFFSYRQVEQPRLGAFVRVSELWYENADAWRKAVVESPAEYTQPAWADYDRYPFLQPAVDFVCQFLLEAPTDDFKRYLRPYITTA